MNISRNLIHFIENILFYREKKPLIWKHLEFNKVELSLVVTKWFICLFVEVLPIEVRKFINKLILEILFIVPFYPHFPHLSS